MSKDKNFEPTYHKRK